MSNKGRGCLFNLLMPGKRNKKDNKENDRPVARQVKNLDAGSGRGCFGLSGLKSRKSR